MEEFGEEFTDEWADAWIHRADADGDGQLDYEEFWLFETGGDFAQEPKAEGPAAEAPMQDACTSLAVLAAALAIPKWLFFKSKLEEMKAERETSGKLKSETKEGLDTEYEYEQKELSKTKECLGNEEEKEKSELKNENCVDESDKTEKDLIGLLSDNLLLDSGFNLDKPTQLSSAAIERRSTCFADLSKSEKQLIANGKTKTKEGLDTEPGKTVKDLIGLMFDNLLLTSDFDFDGPTQLSRAAVQIERRGASRFADLAKSEKQLIANGKTKTRKGLDTGPNKTVKDLIWLLFDDLLLTSDINVGETTKVGGAAEPIQRKHASRFADLSKFEKQLIANGKTKTKDLIELLFDEPLLTFGSDLDEQTQFGGAAVPTVRRYTSRFADLSFNEKQLIANGKTKQPVLQDEIFENLGHSNVDPGGMHASEGEDGEPA